MCRRILECWSIQVALLAFFVLASPGCSGPCRALSDTICDCKPNQPEVAACVERIRLSAAEKDEVTPAEEAACEARLETCTCEALEDGNLVACGLSKAP